MAEYHKWRFNAEWYSKLVGKLVLKASAKIGMLGAYNSAIGVTPFERYELGGDGIANFNIEGKDIISLRGYDVNDIPGSSGGGAIAFDKFTLELRYPLSLNPQATVYVLTFLEGGNAWKTFKDFNPLEIRRTVGAGVRIFLPMFGTLGFDYGIGFDKTTSTNKLDEYGRFSIILGFEPE